MSRSLNKVTLIGRIGNDPETKTFENGGSVVNFSLATSEQGKDRTSGEKQEKTEWHSIAVKGKLAEIVSQYGRKGALVYIEGNLSTRNWEQDGETKYKTEVVLGFNAQYIMLDSVGDNQQTSPAPTARARKPAADQFDDDIEF
jgi:single-strand DNA-binding protein